VLGHINSVYAMLGHVKSG